jgi:hypothetical protein
MGREWCFLTNELQTVRFIHKKRRPEMLTNGRADTEWVKAGRLIAIAARDV